MHFLQITELDFGKKMSYIAMNFKNYVGTHNFFLDSSSSCEDLLFLHSHKPGADTGGSGEQGGVVGVVWGHATQEKFESVDCKLVHLDYISDIINFLRVGLQPPQCSL